MLCEGRGDVNEFSSATGTYETLATTGLPGGRSARSTRASRFPRIAARIANDKLFDSGQMIQHGPAGAIFIPSPDRAEDAPVILMRALRPARREQALLPALT